MITRHYLKLYVFKSYRSAQGHLCTLIIHYLIYYLIHYLIHYSGLALGTRFTSYLVLGFGINHSPHYVYTGSI